MRYRLDAPGKKPYFVEYAGGSGELVAGSRVRLAKIPSSSTQIKEAMLVYGLKGDGVSVPPLFFPDLVQRWGLVEELSALLDAGVPPHEAILRIHSSLAETARRRADLLDQVKIYLGPGAEKPEVYVLGREVGGNAELLILLAWRYEGRIYEVEPVLARFSDSRLEALVVRIHYLPKSGESAFMYRSGIKNHSLLPVPESLAASLGVRLDLRSAAVFGPVPETPAKPAYGPIYRPFKLPGGALAAPA